MVVARIREIEPLSVELHQVATVKYLAPTSLAAGGSATVWTPATGKAIRLKFLSISVDTATQITVTIGTTDIMALRFPDAGTILMNLVGSNVQGAADEALSVTTSEAATVSATAIGDEV